MDEIQKIKVNFMERQRAFIENTLNKIFVTEKIIVTKPYLGTVRDGGKGFYADELRKILAEFVGKYYAMENPGIMDGFAEFIGKEKEMYSGGNSTEDISRMWAVNRIFRELAVWGLVREDGTE